MFGLIFTASAVLILADGQPLETDLSLNNPTRIIFEDDRPVKFIFNAADDGAPNIAAEIGTGYVPVVTVGNDTQADFRFLLKPMPVSAAMTIAALVETVSTSCGDETSSWSNRVKPARRSQRQPSRKNPDAPVTTGEAAASAALTRQGLRQHALNMHTTRHTVSPDASDVTISIRSRMFSPNCGARKIPLQC